jgi:excisionase family DNA binding protein
MTGAPSPEYLTVPEVADLLRLKERKVYDLAANGSIPCSRATGKLLFPAASLRAWIDRQGAGAEPRRRSRPPIVLGSHDPLLDWAIRESGSGLATFLDGSGDGLTRFGRGEGIATGLHLPGADGDWNVEAARAAATDGDAVLVDFARRRRGLIFRPDAAAVSGLRDLAGLRFVPRQPGAGSQRLFERRAAQEGLDLDSLTCTEVARTEDDAAAAIGRGEAEVAFGLEASARAHGLAFRPIAEEAFALLVDRAAWFDPPWQRLWKFLSGEAAARRAASFGGYDLSAFGTVLWNA